MDRVQYLWSSSPEYHKIESHVRNGSVDTLVEEERLRSTIRALRRWLFLLGILLCISLLALGTNVALQHRDIGQKKSPLPQFPTKMVTFQADDKFAGPPTVERDQAWHSLMPVSDGFILVDQPEQYNLQPGLLAKGVPGELYDIAVFHQIHCLTRIREYLNHLRFAVDNNQTEQVAPILLNPQQDHILHCFDYLRQSLMCSADLTLEWAVEEEDGRRRTVDGWGIPHQCVDLDAVVEHVTSNFENSR